MTVLHDDRSPAPEPADTDLIRRRFAFLQQRVADAAGDRPVTVVAVTKGFGPEAVDAVMAAGLRDVGESYAKELQEKSVAVASTPRWHYLGAVQRRSVRDLARHVQLWQSVDREAAAAEIARHAPGAWVLVQVNVTGAPGRNGCSWEDAPGLVDRSRALGLDVRGLMAVAGREDPRSDFRRLARVGRELELTELSMGMSGDLEVALEEGSTMIRVGRALLGERPVPDLDGRQG